MRRRTYLQGAGATAVTAAIAGCSNAIERVTGDGDDGPPRHELRGESAWYEERSQTSDTQWRFVATVVLEPGQYAARPLDPDGSGRYTITWETDGFPIDVYVLGASEYETGWRERESMQFDAALSEQDAPSGSVSGTISSGDPVLIVSNSERYGSDPAGTVWTQLEVTAPR
jgi:hypothetical protein